MHPYTLGRWGESGLHPWPTTQGTPRSHTSNILTSPGREKVLTEAPVSFVLSLSTTCRNALGWREGLRGGPLILETQAQKADGQIEQGLPDRVPKTPVLGPG